MRRTPTIQQTAQRLAVIAIAASAVCLGGCGGGGSESSAPQPPAPPASGAVTVDLSRRTGPASQLYGLSLQANAGSIAIEDFSGLGNFRLDLGWPILATATSLADVQARLATAHPESAIAPILARGGEVTIDLVMMPPYLSSLAGDSGVDPASGWAHRNAAPPTSLAGWSALVEAVVTYFSVTHGLAVRYEVWNEPDLTAFWRGTRAEFFALYHASALGARRASATAVIGGPTISSLESGATSRPATDGWMREFIAFCAATPIPEVALSRTPIDFLVWHEFHVIPRWVAYRVPQVRQWLTAAGYPATTPLMIDEWNINLEGQNAPDVGMPLSDTAEAAAFAVASVFNFRRVGLDRHAYSSLGDWSSGSSDFHGGQGIVTRSDTRKPVYRALQCLSQLVGDEADVVITHSSPFVDAAATVGPDGIAVLVVNHVPDPRTAFNQAATVSTPDSATAVELGNLDPDDVMAIYEDTVDPAFVAMSASARAVLITAQQAARDARLWRGRSTTVPISVRGLTAPMTHERRYAVDASRSNGHAAYLAAIAGGASEATAIAAAKTDDGLDLTSERDVAPGVVSATVEAESNSVWLITYSDVVQPPLSIGAVRRALAAAGVAKRWQDRGARRASAVCVADSQARPRDNSGRGR